MLLVDKSIYKYLIPRFMWFLLFEGYHIIPQTTLYWSVRFSNDSPNNIAEYVHEIDNVHANNDNLNISAKFAKVRPLFDMLNKLYIQFGVFVKHFSIYRWFPTSDTFQRKCLYVEYQSVSGINFGRSAPAMATCFSLFHIRVHLKYIIRFLYSLHLS